MTRLALQIIDDGTVYYPHENYKVNPHTTHEN